MRNLQGILLYASRFLRHRFSRDADLSTPNGHALWPLLGARVLRGVCFAPTLPFSDDRWRRNTAFWKLPAILTRAPHMRVRSVFTRKIFSARTGSWKPDTDFDFRRQISGLRQQGRRGFSPCAEKRLKNKVCCEHSRGGARVGSLTIQHFVWAQETSRTPNPRNINLMNSDSGSVCVACVCVCVCTCTSYLEYAEKDHMRQWERYRIIESS